MVESSNLWNLPVVVSHSVMFSIDWNPFLIINGEIFNITTTNVYTF